MGESSIVVINSYMWLLFRGTDVFSSLRLIDHRMFRDVFMGLIK